MGHRGFCRLRPVHIASMIKRYRQLRGQVTYLRKHEPDSDVVIHDLEAGIKALAEVIYKCDPETDLAALRAISYQPAGPLPRSALNRAILSILRVSTQGCSLSDLIDALVTQNSIIFLSAIDAARFASRCKLILRRQGVKGLLRLDGDRYSIHSAVINESLVRLFPCQ